MISGLRELGKTILLTTHYMDEAQALADRVAIIAAGRIVAEGTPADLAAAQRGTQIRFTLPAEAAPAELPRVSGEVATRGRNVEISTDDPTHDLLALTSWGAGRGAGRLDGLTVTRPSLEDIYLTLTSDTEDTGMNPLVLAARESGNVLRSFWRNRSGAFFTILLPVMFLVFFGAINRDGTVQLSPHGPQVSYTTFFAPGMLGMAIMAGAFVGLVIGLTIMRDNGQLKRLRGTPLPPWAFFSGQVVSRLVLVAVEAVLVLGLGRLLFHVSLPPSAAAWATFALVVLLGAATFTAVGVAYTRLVGQRRLGAGARQRRLPASAVPVGCLVPDQPACPTGWPRSPTPSRSPPCWTACARP